MYQINKTTGHATKIGTIANAANLGLGGMSLSAPPASHAQVLFAVGSGVGDGSSNLYKIVNYASGPKAVNIGESGVLLTDLAINPKTGAAFAISFTDLYSINLTTGKVTDIGPLDAPGMNALTFSSNGTLYAMSSDTTDLYTIDLKSGKATVVFDTGYISSGDLAFNTDGTLYLTTASDLVKINVSGKKATDVGSLGVSDLFGLVIDSSGQFYAAQGSNRGPTAVMYRINKTTGHATKIGTIANAAKLGLDGLSF
jgi:hypothetical protein